MLRLLPFSALPALPPWYHFFLTFGACYNGYNHFFKILTLENPAASYLWTVIDKRQCVSFRSWGCPTFLCQTKTCVNVIRSRWNLQGAFHFVRNLGLLFRKLIGAHHPPGGKEGAQFFKCSYLVNGSTYPRVKVFETKCLKVFTVGPTTMLFTRFSISRILLFQLKS